MNEMAKKDWLRHILIQLEVDIKITHEENGTPTMSASTHKCYNRAEEAIRSEIAKRIPEDRETDSCYDLDEYLINSGFNQCLAKVREELL